MTSVTHSQPVIRVEGLSKSYDVYNKPQDFVWEYITGKVRHDVFWALRNISFDIYEKQRIGIVGSNGAGKSTLLKILTNNLVPTSGKITVNGKVSALLSLASSLNPEESGLENIRFNLLLNGVSQKMIPHLTDDIVEFAEIGSFIYAPVKTYSSGMNARLSFGIATAMEPEILVVDEVLSVGDGYFLGKAYERMMRLVDRGKALIFVSHSVAEVRKLCDTVLWLENGSIRMIGEAGYVCTRYEEDYQNNQTIQQKEKNKTKYKIYASDGINTDNLKNYDILVRIVPKDNNKSFKDVHYVRSISFKSSNVFVESISLEDQVKEDSVCKLDILGSEWGRMYDRQGVQCRSLMYQTGKMRGGILLCRSNSNVDEQSINTYEISFEASSLSQTESLELDYFDTVEQQWKTGSCNIVEMNDGWYKFIAEVEIPVASAKHLSSIIESAKHKKRKCAELVGARILVDGKPEPTVTERCPFEVQVDFIVNEPIEVLDIHLLIYRSDGVYVFWQPSGLNNVEIMNAHGKYSANFIFDPNLLGAGHYYVNATLKDKWDLLKHYNEYEVYDNSLHICEFQVIKEYNVDMVDFGIINNRVNVSITQR